MSSLPPAAVAVHLTDIPDDDWLAAWWAVDGRGGVDELATAREILTGTAARYASVRRNGRTLAVGRACVDSGVAAIHCLATLPHQQGAGLGTAVMRALAADSLQQGASQLWLQVLANNTGARDLYRRLGFTVVGGYRYYRSPAA